MRHRENICKPSKSTKKQSDKRHKQRKLKHIDDQFFKNTFSSRIRNVENLDALSASSLELSVDNSGVSDGRHMEDNWLDALAIPHAEAYPPSTSVHSTPIPPPGPYAGHDEQNQSFPSFAMPAFGGLSDVSYVTQAVQEFTPIAPPIDYIPLAAEQTMDSSVVFDGLSYWNLGQTDRNFSDSFDAERFPQMPLSSSNFLCDNWDQSNLDNANLQTFHYPTEGSSGIVYDSAPDPTVWRDQAYGWPGRNAQ
ncbi:hypothetical protein CVT26_005159 [Gymnopilus dilepis]|uniref:Uncharacterized protein n=1 Tax=Gymnopilus dilepis TaxID=231916 RepID=A0A409YTI3_9AGAR|nr:hypothetical protein CVT26_005159 [Gymnopilus dilepis]